MSKHDPDQRNDLGVPEAEDRPSVQPQAPSSSSKKINPELTISEIKHGVRPGDVYVRMRQSHGKFFRKVGPGHFIATPESDRPASPIERGYRAVKKILIGRPLETAEEIHQRLSKVKALAVFGSDAISSSAYATEASLIVLMVAGNAALGITFYLSLAIAVMLSVIAFSYRQTVQAYPQGGGSYNVSRENLGQLPGLIAAASLLIDYILTVAVSIVAGSAAVTSALIASGYADQINVLEQSLPTFLNLNVILSLFFIGMITLANLRGVRESGSIFAIPTYLFITSLSTMIIIGLIKSFMGTLEPLTTPPTLPTTEPITLWLVLRAFSAGAVAMSGTEAISNGVPAFEKPEAKNAATTLTIMATLLGAFFLGVSYLATHIGLVPGEETVISQVALAVFGKNIFYYIFQIATMGILVIAANTAFADFPRLASVLARDNYMPHQFSFRGDRLAFSTGIIALGGIAALLVIAFQGNVDSLIHLYAVGVFLAFTLSNSGMVIHWWKLRGPNWQTSAFINGIGAVLSIITLIIVVVTKFALGAWVVVLLIPIIVSIFLFIHRHYTRVAEQLRVVPGQLPPSKIDQLVIVPIDDVNYASLRAISFARTISKDVVVLHISTNSERTEKIRQKMTAFAPDMKLVILDSPLRAFVRPLLAYVDAVHSQYPGAFVTIVLPEFITAHAWEAFLHNRTARRLRDTFERHPNVAVVLVPYLLEK
ncbi:MAG: APC family permease [Chloroflexi bacterium]|nr:APC family permease [Chloroflexota bacterium]